MDIEQLRKEITEGKIRNQEKLIKKSDNGESLDITREARGYLSGRLDMLDKLEPFIDSQQSEIEDLKSIWESLGQVIELNKKTINDYIKADTMNRATIERLKGENERLKGDKVDLINCITSIHQVDLPRIDDLCDIQGFHRFTLMRKEIEKLIKLPTEPKDG